MVEGLNLTSLRKHDPEEAIYGSSLVGVVCFLDRSLSWAALLIVLRSRQDKYDFKHIGHP